MTEPAVHAPSIVVGVDGSESSKDALRWAAREATLSGGSLRVLSSWHIPAMAYGAMAPLPAALASGDATREVLLNTVAEVLGDEPGFPYTTEVVNGPPALELLEAARTADLLVVGNRGHGAFAGMLLGSVSEHCVAHAPCPVVVVRHEADA